jgi:hypothetical protein
MWRLRCPFGREFHEHPRSTGLTRLADPVIGNRVGWVGLLFPGFDLISNCRDAINCRYRAEAANRLDQKLAVRALCLF